MTSAEHEAPSQDGRPQETRSIGDIISDVTEGLGTLVRQEIDLAKTELKSEVATMGKGAGMLGGAGLAAVLVLVFASLTVIFLLDDWLPLELAALIVTVFWVLVAAVLALVGRSALKSANPQLPTTQQTVKENVQWAKNQ